MNFGRKVRIEDATSAIISVGDNSPITVTRGDEPVFGLTPLTSPPTLPTGAGPARLLGAQYELVPFVGREASLLSAEAWLSSELTSGAHLITAAGGQGKTRLALEIGRRAGGRGWGVLLARHGLDAGLLLGARDQVDLTQPTDCEVGTLVVVDYAERWPRGDLFELFKRTDVQTGKVRVLLLARSAWFWPTLERSLQRAGIQASSEALAVDETDTGRSVMYAAAVSAFSSALAVDPEPQPPTPRGVTNLDSPAFDLTLSVHISALISVLQWKDHEAGVVAPQLRYVGNEAALTRELLVREVEHWDGLRNATNSPISISDQEMSRAVVVATLTRGLPINSSLRILDSVDIGPAAKKVVYDHSVPYPPSSKDRVLEPLRPDRLGEDFIASFIPGDDYPESQLLAYIRDPFAKATIDKLVDREQTEAVRTQALMLLTEVAARWGHVAAYLLELVYDAPEQLIDCGSEALVRAASIEVLAPLMPRLGKALDSIVGSRPHLDLDVGACAVQERLVEQARESGVVSPHLASTLNRYSIRLFRTGRIAEAVTAAKESVHFWRLLAGYDVTYTIELSRALGNLAATYAELRDFRSALDYSEEEIALAREAAKLEPGQYLDEIGGALANQANNYASVEQYDHALSAIRESVALHEKLITQDSSHLPNAAAALEALGRILHLTEKPTEAATVFRRALKIRRALADENPDTHLASLAGSLNNLGIVLREQDAEGALVTDEECVKLFRRLVDHNKLAFEHGLASALHGLALSLGAASRVQESEPAIAEAVDRHRSVLRERGTTASDSLACSLKAHALILLCLGRTSEALGPARESVSQYKHLETTDAVLFRVKRIEAEQILAFIEQAVN